jgi:hypothetical protein
MEYVRDRCCWRIRSQAQAGVPVASGQETSIRALVSKSVEQNEGLRPHIRWTKILDFIHVYRGILPVNRVFFLTSLSGSFGEILGGKPVQVFLCDRPVSSIHPSNELMRRCLLRWQTETSGDTFSHFGQHFLGVSFKDRFRDTSQLIVK